MDIEDRQTHELNIPCCGVVKCVEFSPFQWSSSLIAFACSANLESDDLDHRICIGTYDFHKEAKSATFSMKKEYHHSQPTSLSWSPQTALLNLPHTACLAVGSKDGRVTVITSDLKDSNEISVLGSHRKCVNAVCFDRADGQMVASVGDDYRCILWSTEGEMLAEFPLKSAGVDVQFQKEDNSKLAVGEKGGVIRFYDLSSKSAFMSVETGNSPLKSFAWSVPDITNIHALVGSTWFIFDTSKSSSPVQTIEIGHGENGMHSGKKLRLSPVGHLVAIAGGKGNGVMVFSQLRGAKVLADIPSSVGSGISWHNSSNCLAIGSENKVLIVVLESM